jgi:formylglycine-generating enzyme required for sulfatase activity
MPDQTQKTMERHRSFSLTLSLTALFSVTIVCANNIQVSNSTLKGTNTMDAYTMVEFDITWENSWRTEGAPSNWDAAWVFVKYRDANTGQWNHARLHGDVAHVAPIGTVISTGLLDPGSPFDIATNWGVGAFLYRSADGNGTFSATNVQLRWNYGENGITEADIAEVKIFALEMVYIPEESFSVGSGGGETNKFKDGPSNAPIAITSEAAISIGNVLGQLWASGAIEAATIPASFPKGYAAVYMMKHSIAQQDYVDFLNTLSRIQQNTRTGTNLAVGVTSVTNRYVMRNNIASLNRTGIRCDATVDANDPITFYCDLNGNGIGGEAGDGQWIECNFLSWADVAAYLDWSGLRPMTELEFEKACRGPVAPVINEYAWGNGSLRIGNYTIAQSGAIGEVVSDPETGTTGNMLYNGAFVTPSGPGRVGLFAGGATTRIQSGASYYGLLELSGNVWERPVTVGNATGRAFTGVQGNGSVDATGNADEVNWPGIDAVGAGYRGGSWNSDSGPPRVSDRIRAAFVLTTRGNVDGGRGVRTEP